MPYSDLPVFITKLQNKNTLSANALYLLILTATRTSELLEAKWCEFDLKNAIWTIPASRMKSKVEHRIPLSSATMKILNALPSVENNPYTLPGSRIGRPLSNMTLLKLMRDMDYGVNCSKGDYVPHGFRSSFRDWSGEESSFPRDVAEMALAHVIENKVEAAYRRGDLFEKRRQMMQEWADYIDELKEK